MASEVHKDFADGQSEGVRGTPAFFVNGKMISGAQPFSAFENIIESFIDDEYVEFGNKELDLKIKPVDYQRSVRQKGETHTQEFNENIPKKQQELVINYFEELAISE